MVALLRPAVGERLSGFAEHAVPRDLVGVAGIVENRRREVVHRHLPRQPLRRRDGARAAQDQRHANVRVVQTVVIEIAAVLVHGLAVVGGEQHERVLVEAKFAQPRQQVRNGHIRVGNGRVVLGDDVFEVPHAGQPRVEVVGERFEREHLLERRVLRRLLVALVEHPMERPGREIRRVRVPVVDEQEPRLVLPGARVEQVERDLVHRLGFALRLRVVGLPRVATVVGESALEPASDGVRRSGVVAQIAEDLRHHSDAVGGLPVRAVGYHLVREGVVAGHHRGERRMRRDVRRDHLAEQRALGGEPVDVRTRHAGVAVAAEVVGAKRVDDDHQDVHMGLRK